MRGTDELVAVEFLHATFGEYLVARLIDRQLTRMLSFAEYAAANHLNPSGQDADLLLGIIGFVPLTVRTTIMDTLVQRIGEPERRARLGEMLQRLFREIVSGERFDAGTYRPVAQTPAAGKPCSRSTFSC